MESVSSTTSSRSASSAIWGLNKTAKLVGQFVAAIAFGILALQFRGDDGLTPGSVHLSYVRDIATVSLGSVVFIAFCYLLVSAWSNAVNLTDGLDGLAAGAMSFVLGAYVIITFWAVPLLVRDESR